jgi:hypothetical protein
MPLLSTRDLKEDVLFRSGEPLTTSGWEAKAIDYLNRVYETLASGASEFLPEYVEDWWWLRESGVILLNPVHTTGTLDLTSGSASITFSSAPADSKVGWKLKVPGHPDIFTIATHTAGVAAATLDAAWTGDDNSAATYQLMKTMYSLSASVSVLIGPMIGFRHRAQINGVAPERMDFLYPLGRLSAGPPEAFSLENEQTVRFSHGGLKDGTTMRVEYRYRPVLTALTDSDSDFPLVPKQWRHILSDMATTLVMMDKNDDRSNSVALLARTGLAGMLKENRRRLAKIDKDAGRVYPRQTVSRRLTTESGLVIG